jgi:hypothetical protein
MYIYIYTYIYIYIYESKRASEGEREREREREGNKALLIMSCAASRGKVGNKNKSDVRDSIDDAAANCSLMLLTMP